MANNVVVKSYYIIKIEGILKGTDTYVADISNKGRIKRVSSEDKAKRYEFFGLKNMEKALLKVGSHVEYLHSKGVRNIVIVSRDVTAKLAELKNTKFPKIRQLWENYAMWNKIIDENTIDEMIKLSEDEDAEGEASENYVSIHKFLSHVRELDYKTVVVMALHWNTFDEMKQVKLAISYAGEYSASRFMMFMDYASNKLGKTE